MSAIAMHLALKEVKRRRQQQGLREPLPFSTLSRMAIEHLHAHPELLAEAALSPTVQNLRDRRRTAKVEWAWGYAPSD
jgi:hypothetical protein